MTERDDIILDRDSNYTSYLSYMGDNRGRDDGVVGGTFGGSSVVRECPNLAATKRTLGALIDGVGPETPVGRAHQVAALANSYVDAGDSAFAAALTEFVRSYGEARDGEAS